MLESDHTAGNQGRDRRRVWVLLAIATTAAVTAALAPPVGLVLGCLTVVLAVKYRGDLKTSGLGPIVQTFPLIAGIFAIITGAVLSILMLIFRQELGDFRSCMSGANTHIAQERCMNEFEDQISQRLGF